MIFTICFVAAFVLLWKAPAWAERAFIKLARRIIKKQIKHEIRRFR
jgi:hypothetical protein